MMNSPVYSEQLELDSYWSTKDRTHELLGLIQSPDYFIRGFYYLRKLPPAKDIHSALAGVISVIHNISVPWGTSEYIEIFHFDLLLSRSRSPQHQSYLVEDSVRSNEPHLLFLLR